MKVFCLLSCGLVLCLCAVEGIRSETISLDDALYYAGNGENGTNHPDPDYKLKEVSDTGGSLATLYRMSRKFAEAVGPKDTIIDEILDFVDEKKKVESSSDVLKLVQMEQGFMACLVLGLLLFFGLGIAGTFFCCCRCCCGNCGGKKVQRPDENSSTSRKTYAFLLFLTVILMLVAVGCGYMVSASMSDAVLKTEDTLVDIVDDANIFFNSTAKDLEELGIGGLKQTTQQIKEELKGIRKNIGEPLRNVSVEELRVVEPSVSDIDKVLAALKKAKDSIDSDVTKPIQTIEETLQDTKTELTAIKTDCGALCVRMKVDANVVLPEVDAGKLDLPSGIWKQIKEESQKIPQTVDDNTKESVKDAEKKIDDFVSDFQKGDFQKAIDESSEVTKFVADFKRDLKDTYRDIKKYQPYWYYAMAGVVTLVTVPVLLLCLGMLCGCAGHREARHPADRGGLSNCGGCTIITGVYLLFFITGIPILVTTILFQIGGHAQTVVCSTMYQEDLKTFDKIVDHLKKNEKANGGDFLKSFSASRTFKMCESGSTVYQAMDLENHFNLEKELNVKDKLNLHEKLKNIKIEVKMDDITKKAEDIKNLNTKDMNDLLDELRKNLDVSDLANWIQNLEGQSTIAGFPARLKDRLDAQINKLKDLKDKTIKQLKDNKEKIAIDLDRVDVTDLKGKAEEMLKKFEVILGHIEMKASTTKDEFVTNLEQIVTAFADDALNKTKYQIGKCKQIWILYDVTRHQVCRNILDPLNAYWFCLGWALVFSIFAIAFGAKLSRHYERMSDMKRPKWSDETESEETICSSTGRGPAILMRESDLHYTNQGYHSPPPYGGPAPHYGYGPQPRGYKY